MNKTVIVSAALVLCCAAGCGNDHERSFAGSGLIEATEITVSAETPGKIMKLTFDEGDRVKAGEMIAEIDVEELQLQRDLAATDLADLDWTRRILEKEAATAKEAVSQASIALGIADKTDNRIRNLYEQKIATQEQLDRADTELAMGESRVRSAEKQLAVIEARLGSLEAKREKVEAQFRLLDSRIADGQVKCSADGTIIEKYVEPGEVVNFGSPVCTIADLSTVWLKIYVGEEMLGTLRIGEKAGVRIDSHPGRTFEGMITWISPRSEFTPKNVQTKDSRVELVYAVKITMDNPEGIFKIGMPADVYIEGLETGGGDRTDRQTGNQ